MADNILGQVALAYSPMVDRHRAVSATRLTVFPIVPGAALDAAALLDEVVQVWPADGGQVSLNVLSEGLLQGLLDVQPAANVMLEVPAFMAGDEAHTAAIVALHAKGNTLMLKGRPLRELPREVLPCFRHSIIDLADDRRVNEPPSLAASMPRQIGHVQSGVHTLADMDGAFQRGAVAVLGWPMDDAMARAAALRASNKGQAAPDLQVMVQLINQLEREEPIETLEATLRRDPTLAFKLMRYINSPAFGLSVEISSFRHAMMLLGYGRLKRWLALLLATASKDVNLKPVMFAAVRRGMFLEELARGSGGDDEMRGELFICGVFSLLDRMFGQPFSELLGSLPVPERVFQALAESRGPYKPYCDMMVAAEGDQLDAIRDACDGLIADPSEVNRALLRALSNAATLD